LVDGGIKKGEAFYNLPFTLFDSTTRVPAAGFTPAGEFLQDDNLSAGWQTISAAIVDVGNGTYVLSELDVVMTDCDALTLRFTATGADSTTITFFPK
jgi:hypothetical protein